MKNIVFIVFNLLIINSLLAQKITIDEAIKIGLDNRIDLKNQQLQVQIAQTENDKLKAKWLPQVGANADFRWNTQLQSTIIPAGSFGSTEPVKLAFGTPFNNNLGLQIDQKIYDATRKYDQKINDVQVESQRNTLEDRKTNVRQSVIEAYYGVLYNLEKVQLAQKLLERNQTNTQNAQAKLSKGTLLQNDVDRFLLDLSNAQLSLTKAQQDYDLALANLAFQMGLSHEAKVEPTETLQDIFKSTQVADYEKVNFENRTEIKTEEINSKLNELNQQKQKKINSPTISAYGNYSLLQLSQRFNPFEFSVWSPFNYVGLKASIPIFDGKQTKIEANNFAIRQKINQNYIEKYKSDFMYESKSTSKILRQAQADIAETQKNINLAKQIYDTDKLRFDKGVLTLSDLKNTEYALQTAENNYLNAVYNFLLANVRYKKAVGDL